MIVFTPELEVPGLEDPSTVLWRSKAGPVAEDRGSGGDGGAIIVMYDSTGGYKLPRIKLPGSRNS